MDKNNQEVDLFAYKLDYETAGRWDGNIGKQTWNNTSNQVRSYTFAYDYAKRLKSGTYSGVGAENYSLTNVNYDKNGNILNLVRNGNLGSSFGVMDNLTYTYTGNKLYKVEDAVSGDYTVDFVNRNTGTNDYDYYSDGSLKKDLNKEITQIDYDPFLKLPKQITLTNNRWIKITYAGDGRVLKRTYSTGEYWEYDGALVHKNGQPYQLATPEGRATYASGVWTYEYFIQDHLGNTRVSFKANGSSPQATDYTNYDPWGIELNGTGLNNPVENRFKYQSKESLTLFGLSGINDFGARYYDKTVGRWWGVDLHSDSYRQYSSYSYAINNPIRIIDPNGMDVFFLIWDSQAMNSSDLFESMLTRKKEIEGSKGFNSKSDHIYTLDVSDLGKLKELVDSKVKDAKKNKYGKTVEVSFFTHGGSDGPVGSSKSSGEYRLSYETGEPSDANQLSLEGWKNINWNLDSRRNIICAYGCNTADWASDVSKIEGVSFSAGQSGKTGGTYDLEKWNSVWINLFERNAYQRSKTGDNVNSMFIYQNGIEISSPDKKPIKENPTFEIVNKMLIVKTPKGIK